MVLWFFTTRVSQHTRNWGNSCALPIHLVISSQESSGVCVWDALQLGECGGNAGVVLGLLVLQVTHQPASILVWIPASVGITHKIPTGRSIPLEDILPGVLRVVAVKVLIHREGWWILQEGQICYICCGVLVWALCTVLWDSSARAAEGAFLSLCCVSINVSYLQIPPAKLYCWSNYARSKIIPCSPSAPYNRTQVNVELFFA